MRTVDIREVLTTSEPKKNAKHVEAIVGRTLGDISVEELMQAAHSVKADPYAVQSATGISTPMQEVFIESEEE